MKIIKFFFSGAFMGILLLAFAYAIGYATFIENDYGAIAAKMLVYNAKWFEVLLFFMVVNFAGMIFTKHLYLKAKLNILVMHIALIIIILGAGVTRYYGYEGSMHIRAGQTTNEFKSADTFLQVRVGEGDAMITENENILLTTVRSELVNTSIRTDAGEITISAGDYFPRASLNLINNPNGEPYISLEVRSREGSNVLNLKEGDVITSNGITFNFGDTTNNDQVQILYEDGQFLFRNVYSPEQLAVLDPVTILPGGFVIAERSAVFIYEKAAFRVANLMNSALPKYEVASDNMQMAIPIINVRVNDQERFIPINATETFNISGQQVRVRVGDRTLLLPFELRLEKFDLERYPGSNSPSSFASDVTLIDKANNKEFPYRIYMNNILNYGGFRFFQSSYDQDEKGTILSVNHDYWGTLITYIGYFLLFATLIISFFTKTRFKRIALQLEDVHSRRKKIKGAAALIGLVIVFAATDLAAQSNIPDKSHAAEFGKLFVQNNAGRIEPMNTLATKLLVKVSKKSKFNGYTADQVILGIATNPTEWQGIPIIKVPESAIQNMLGINGDLASFNDFIDASEQYKIATQVEQAYIKKPATRSTLDKGLINVDERLNVFYTLLSGSAFKIFPIENDPNNTWVNPQEYHQKLGHGNGEADLFEAYTNAILEAGSNSTYITANARLQEINQLQQKYGAAVLPSPAKAKVEILYNNANIFKNLFPVYLVLGILLVGIFLIQIFYPTFEFKLLGKILMIIMAISFALQTIGLSARWYISGHAPWSNGYESMIYISWATVLAGFLFMKRSSVTLGVTALLAGITLLTAHMSWLNPEVTNLVPVLKSYWLTFHVATITASYGFLALGCMLAFLNLCIMIFRTKANQINVNLTLRELMLITEMSIAVGLVLLVIGNFLGGIWANESWGRYWGWDPKETWTLVTVILYSFTLHLTLIPAIRNTFTFSFFSFISFGAVLMTYFGVNYYLSGLHSYANGDPVAIPTFIYYALGVIAVISVLAAYNDFKFTKAEDTVE